MFYTINKSSKSNLPIAISLIHLAPIFSLFLVYFYFNKKNKYWSDNRDIYGIYRNINSDIFFYLTTSTAYFFNNS